MASPGHTAKVDVKPPSTGKSLRIKELLETLDTDGDGDIDDEDRAIKAALLKMDQDGDGEINLRELVNIGKDKVTDARKISNLKKYLIGGGVIMLIFIALSLCSTIAAIEMTKETRSGSDNQMVDSRTGAAIMTAPTQDAAGAMISPSGKGLSTATSTRTIELSMDTPAEDLYKLTKLTLDLLLDGMPSAQLNFKPETIVKSPTSLKLYSCTGWTVTLFGSEATVLSPDGVEYTTETRTVRRRGLLENTQSTGQGVVTCDTSSGGICSYPSCVAGQYIAYDENNVEIGCTPCGTDSAPEAATPPFNCVCTKAGEKWDIDSNACFPDPAPALPVPDAVTVTTPGMMPDEGDPHVCTWMAFAGDVDIWGTNLAATVKDDLVRVASSIAMYEPVKMLVSSKDMAEATAKLGATPNVTLIPHEVNDLWMRDTGPVFVKDPSGAKRGVDFNFNGWGEKQVYAKDALVAGGVAYMAGVPLTRSSLVMEGGGIEVDGHGTAIITESCVLNDNRNPNVTKEQAEEELKFQLGLTKIIWLPGIKGKEITDGHTDFYARFTKPGQVVAAYDDDPSSFDHEVTKRHLEILENATDAQGNLLDVIVIPGPTTVRGGFTEWTAAGYINFYMFNGGVLMPEFGDASADAFAKTKLQEAYPDRDVIQIPIDGIAGGGGGIHCSTQQEPV